MATRLPSALPRRPTTALPFTALQTTHVTATTPYLAPSHTPLSRTPSRAATLIKRPRRPYTFTQLVQLSDGSTYTMRTSSPLAMYKSTKDTRNHVLWNPNEQSLQNVEVDEAGKLAAFRGRFGRGWDAAATPEDGAGEEDASKAGSAGSGSGLKDVAESDDAFADLIAGYAASMPDQQPKASKPPPEKKKK